MYCIVEFPDTKLLMALTPAVEACARRMFGGSRTTRQFKSAKSYASIANAFLRSLQISNSQLRNRLCLLTRCKISDEHAELLEGLQMQLTNLEPDEYFKVGATLVVEFTDTKVRLCVP